MRGQLPAHRQVRGGRGADLDLTRKVRQLLVSRASFDSKELRHPQNADVFRCALHNAPIHCQWSKPQMGLAPR